MEKCRICYKTFGDVVGLRMHVIRKHNYETKRSVNFKAKINEHLPKVQDVEQFVHEPDNHQQLPEVLISNQYLNYQENILSALEKYASIREMKKVKKSNSVYANGNHEIYLAIFLFTTQRPQMSEDDNTELLNLIKAITLKNCDEIPLPSRYVDFL